LRCFSQLEEKRGKIVMISHLTVARFLGLACIIGSSLFTITVPVVGSPLSKSVLYPILLSIGSLFFVGMAGGPLGVVTLQLTGTGWKKGLGNIGMVLSMLGLLTYSIGSLYIYTAPDFESREFNQLFTPIGAQLTSFGMILLGIAVLSARRERGWQAFLPLLVGLGFYVQFLFQIIFRLSQGQPPFYPLLSAWGLLWILLGWLIWRRALTNQTPEGSRSALIGKGRA
jgi:hypothetical protein